MTLLCDKILLYVVLTKLDNVSAFYFVRLHIIQSLSSSDNLEFKNASIIDLE